MGAPSDQDRPTTIRFPADLKQDLKVQAAKRNTTMEALIVDAYRQYIGGGHDTAETTEVESVNDSSLTKSVLNNSQNGTAGTGNVGGSLSHTGSGMAPPGSRIRQAKLEFIQLYSPPKVTGGIHTNIDVFFDHTEILLTRGSVPSRGESDRDQESPIAGQPDAIREALAFATSIRARERVELSNAGSGGATRRAGSNQPSTGKSRRKKASGE